MLYHALSSISQIDGPLNRENDDKSLSDKLSAGIVLGQGVTVVTSQLYV